MKKIILGLTIISSVTFFSCKEKEMPKPENVIEQAKEEVNLKDYPDSKLFVKADSLDITQVNPNVTRKIAYLDDLLVAIVEFHNGPMVEPDPFHSHEHEQISYIAEGECLVLIGDRKMKLGKGDIFVAPSNVPHSVQSLTPYLKLIDSFSPVREDFIKK